MVGAVCGVGFGVLEGNAKFVNTCPHGEPQLGKRGLYRKLGGFQDVAPAQLAMLWVLNLSDGRHSLLDIARQANLPFTLIRRVASELVACELLRAHT